MLFCIRFDLSAAELYKAIMNFEASANLSRMAEKCG
jgi:hypothetical protein